MGRNKPLVPESREALNRLKRRSVLPGTDASSENDVKSEIAKQNGIEWKKGHNGDLKAEEAGIIGGEIGGSMVRQLIDIAKKDLDKRI